MTIGEWLKQARQAAGMSLEEATFRVRSVLPRQYWVSVSSMHRFESKATPDPVLVVALADIYEADTATMPEGVLEDARAVSDLLIRSTRRISARTLLPTDDRAAA